MEERQRNMEQWLREAAALQEEELSPLSEKQAGWNALRARLDEPSAPRVPWMYWLGGAGALLLAGIICCTLLLGDREGMTEAVRPATATRQPEDKESVPGNVSGQRLPHGDELIGKESGYADTTLPGIESRSDRSRKSATGMAQPGNESAYADTALPRFESRSNRNGNSTTGMAQPRNRNTGDKNGNRGATVSGITSGGARREHDTGMRSAGGLILTGNNPAGTRTGSSNRSESNSHGTAGHDAGGLTNREQPPGTGDATTGILLTPVPTIWYNPANPGAALNPGRNKIPLRTAPQTTPGHARSNFSIKVAGSLPLDKTYGFNVAAEYTFPLKYNIRLRPYLGAGYFAGFTREYRHSAIRTRAVTGGPPTWFWIDSVGTAFNATAIWFGEGGIQAAYVLNRWELSAGLHYRHTWKITGKSDTTVVSRLDSVNRPSQTSRFMPTRLPGAGSLLLHAGIGFMLTPQLQGGLRYNLQLRGQKAADGFTGSVPPPPPHSSLEIQLRWYFRKNKKPD